jgi:membrane protein implicated in regulation of membrane protease activity
MIIVYWIAFVAGLLLGVRVMLFGIERRRSSGVAPSRSSFRSSLPLVAGFATAFGVAGYTLSRIVAPSGALIAAGLIGIAAMGLVRWLVAKSARAAEHDVEDERFVLQGHVARVVSSIGAGGEGRISFDDGTQQRTLRARCLDDASLGEGTEVVIERIEGDLAYVEPWIQVEQRL